MAGGGMHQALLPWKCGHGSVLREKRLKVKFICVDAPIDQIPLWPRLIVEVSQLALAVRLVASVRANVHVA